MNEEANSTRQSLLDLLLHHKGGLTIDEMASILRVSRNAIRQHLAALQRDRLVTVGELRRQVGRPSQLYTLTTLGVEQFPKQYALLAGLVISALRELHGPEGTQSVLKQIVAKLSALYAPTVQDLPAEERIKAVAAILNDLGYVAAGDASGITAVNCVYHHLATEYDEVCQLDIDLIERLLGSRVEHAECMVRGGACCRFRVLSS